MGVSMVQRKAVTCELPQRYRRVSRREKGEILNQLVQLTGYTRSHASWVLRCWAAPCTATRASDRSRLWSAASPGDATALGSTTRRCIAR